MIERGATHLGVATDHVIESFRNDLWPGYKTGAGIDPELLGAVPAARGRAARAAASWSGRWSSSRRTTRWRRRRRRGGETRASSRSCICTPDKDLAQCGSRTRVVQLDRRTQVIATRPAWSRSSASRRRRFRTTWRWSATPPTGIPGSRAGARSRLRPCSPVPPPRRDPGRPAAWDVNVVNAPALAAHAAQRAGPGAAVPRARHAAHRHRPVRFSGRTRMEGAVITPADPGLAERPRHRTHRRTCIRWLHTRSRRWRFGARGDSFGYPR